jgi:LmbE family N-acetylglucosaminyl deacetylase
MKFLNHDRVLVLAPHPDDAEYSMAGIVLKFNKTHFDILCLSKGGSCDPTTSERRHQEVQTAWKNSQVKNYTLFFSENNYINDKKTSEWIQYIEHNHLQKEHYNCIMTTSEYDSHHEHVFVSSLAAPLARIEPLSIIQYRSPSTLETWTPNCFISLGKYYNIKLNMLEAFQSQINKPYFNKTVINGFHTNFQCMKKGLGFIETYKIITTYE